MTKRFKSEVKISRKIELNKNLWQFKQLILPNQKEIKNKNFLFSYLTNENKKLSEKKVLKKKYFKLALPLGEHGLKKKKEKEKFEDQNLSRTKTNTEYNINFKEKQKLRNYYGNINEKQFHNLLLKADRYKGSLENNFLIFLERRLDNLIYRMNFAKTIFGARQLINHGHILVNRQQVTIPSYAVKKGDLIEVKKESYKMVFNNILTRFNHIKTLKHLQNKILSVYPNYIEINYKTLSSILLFYPTFYDVSYHNNKMNFKKVIRFYK
jgi:small subunit ribosomal protein S4